MNGLDEDHRLYQRAALGRGLRDTWVEEEIEDWPYDTVSGADVVNVFRRSYAGVADD